ncbi:MAG: ABC transporter ATP-binding protein [Clostridia bacterium]
MQNAIEIKNLTKEYKNFKLDNINLTVPKGTIMGFIGENGAGKSTTISCILNLVNKDSGEIEVLGTDISDFKIKEEIGVVLDEPCFPDCFKIKDVQKIMSSGYNSWNNDEFLRYIKKFSLPKDKKIKEFSKGMKMKLSIAVALSHNSKLLIMDEATSGLDPVVRNEILDEFLDFMQDEEHSILISSHILSDLEKICDYITFIHKGKIVFSENKDELLEKYAVLKCSKEDFKNIDSEAVIGSKIHEFGVEALVEKDRVTNDLILDKATTEDIMLYFVKEKK